MLEPSKHSFWWRCLEDVFRLRLQKTSWRRLEDVLVKTNIFVLAIRLQDVFKTSSRRLAKTSSRRFQDVLQKRLQDIFDVFKTFWRGLHNTFPSKHFLFSKPSGRRLQRNNFSSSKTSSRRPEDVFKTYLQDAFNTSWRGIVRLEKCYAEDVFKTFSRRIIKLNCS